MKKIILFCLIVLTLTFCGCNNKTEEAEAPTTEYEKIEEYTDGFGNRFCDRANRSYLTVFRFVDVNGNIFSEHRVNTQKGVNITFVADDKEGYEFIGWYYYLGQYEDDKACSITVNDSLTYDALYLRHYERTTMYTTTSLNVRTTPEIANDNLVTTVPVNTELVVLDYDEKHTWDLIEYDGARYFVATAFLSTEKTVVAGVDKMLVLDSNFHYYGIWSEAYYHFTPDQWDAKKGLPIGTTRAWQEYLYSRLKDNGVEWWYEIALAQALQESGWNPFNNQDHHIVSWLGSGENKRATFDMGLFSFKDIFWNSAYGEVCDYVANINAYLDRVLKYVKGTNPNDGYAIGLAISQHYTGNYGTYHTRYVEQEVLPRLNLLWKQ